MINSGRDTDLVTDDELSEMQRSINARYYKRIELYDRGKKFGNTNVVHTMIFREIK